MVLTMPDTMSAERRTILKAYGARLVLTPGAEGMAGAVQRALDLAAETPDSFVPQQFENPANPEVHRLTTAEEIWTDTGRRGGRVRGRRRHRRHAHGRRRRCCASAGPACASWPWSRRIRRCCPAAAPARTASRASAPGFVPKVLDDDVYDEVMTVSGDDAFATARDLARGEGILVGISAGANVWAAGQVAQAPGDARQGRRHRALRHRRALPLHAALRRRGGVTPRC